MRRITKLAVAAAAAVPLTLGVPAVATADDGDDGNAILDLSGDDSLLNGVLDLGDDDDDDDDDDD